MMNRENCIDLSRSSSHESVVEVHRVIDWKEEPRDEIEISESKAGETATNTVQRLKSATLDRMGRMLKIHSKSANEKPEECSMPVNTEDPTRKQKYNSLTRMLRFSDKEGKSKSFADYRGRSLTRMLRKKVPIEADNPPVKPDEHTQGLFTRILGQIRRKHGRTMKSDSESEHPNENSISTLNSNLTELKLETSSPILTSHCKDSQHAFMLNR